jgi:hypothetical protein
MKPFRRAITRFGAIFGSRAQTDAEAPVPPPTALSSAAAASPAASSAGAPTVDIPSLPDTASGGSGASSPRPGSGGSSPHSGGLRVREKPQTPRGALATAIARDSLLLKEDVEGLLDEAGNSAAADELNDPFANMAISFGMTREAADVLGRALAGAKEWKEVVLARGDGSSPLSIDDLRKLSYSSGILKPFDIIFKEIVPEQFSIFLLFDKDKMLMLAISEEAAQLGIPVSLLRERLVARAPSASAAGGFAEARVGLGVGRSDAGFAVGKDATGRVIFAANKDAMLFSPPGAVALEQRLRGEGRPHFANLIKESLNVATSTPVLIEYILASKPLTLPASTFDGATVLIKTRVFGDAGAGSVLMVDQTPVTVRVAVKHLVYKTPGQRYTSCVLALLSCAYFRIWPVNPAIDGAGYTFTSTMVPRVRGVATAAREGVLLRNIDTGVDKFIIGSKTKTKADILGSNMLNAVDVLRLDSGECKLVYVAGIKSGKFQSGQWRLREAASGGGRARGGGGEAAIRARLGAAEAGAAPW